jgi:hypothetical protein
MLMQGMSGEEAWSAVVRARPCASVNPGFLSQLALLEDMFIANSINARAHFIVLAFTEQLQRGLIKQGEWPALPAGRRTVCCTNCNRELWADEYILQTWVSRGWLEKADDFWQGYKTDHLTHHPRFEKRQHIAPVEWVGIEITRQRLIEGLTSGHVTCPSCTEVVCEWTADGLQLCDGFVSALSIVCKSSAVRVTKLWR